MYLHFISLYPLYYFSFNKSTLFKIFIDFCNLLLCLPYIDFYYKIVYNIFKYSTERNKDMLNSKKFCLYCGKTLPRDALFCFECGKEQALDTDLPRKVSSAVRQPQKRSVFSIIKAFLLLFVSISLVVTAFLPVFSVNVQYDKDNSFSSSISAIDAFDLFIYSFDELSEKDLKKEYEEIEKRTEEYSLQIPPEIDAKGSISETSKENLSELMMLTARTNYRRDGVSAPTVLWAAMILFVLYLLACAALLVFSVVYLILAFASPRMCEKAYRGSVTVLTAVPVLITAFYYALSAGLSSAFTADGAKSLGISLGFILPLAISCAAVLFFIISNLIHRLTNKEKESKPKILPRILAAVASVLIIVSLFMPIMSSSARTVFAENDDKKETVIFSHYSDFFTRLHVSEDDFEYYKDLSNSKNKRSEALDGQFAQFSDFTVKQVNGGFANELNDTHITHISSAFGLYQYWWMFALLPLAYTLVLLFFGIILWQSLSCLAGGTYSRATSIVFKILGLLFALASLALVITFVICVRAHISDLGFSTRYAFGINFGSIVMASLATASMFIPSYIFKKKYTDEICEELPIVNEEAPAEEPEVVPTVEEPIPEPEKKPKFCPQCRTKYTGDPAFCNTCGNKLKK